MKRTFSLLNLVILMISLSCVAQQGGHNKYALVIGVSKFNDINFDSLQFSDKDASGFYEFLRKGYIPGMKPENIKKLINDSARYSMVDDLISNWLMGLRPVIKGGDQIYIYWSGHGVITDIDQSLVCRDTKYFDDSYTGSGSLTYDISIGRIKNAINWFAAKTGVKVFLIIDACRIKMKGLNSIPGSVLVITQTPESEGDIYFYSCSTGGPSYETSLLTPGSGVFTYFLLLGLEGGADRHPANGEVTVGELEHFLQDHVTAYVANVLKKGFQTPYIVLKNNEDRNIVISKIYPKSVADKNRRKADSILHVIENAAAVTAATLDAAKTKGMLFDPAPQNSRQPLHTAGGSHNSATVHHPADGRLPMDSSSLLFDSLLYAISRNELVEPKDRSACDYFVRLKNTSKDSLFVDNARRKLVIALVDKVKNFIEAYLDGKLGNTKKDVFDLAYVELRQSIALRPEGDPFIQEFIPKLNFLKARALAGSNKPTDWIEGLRIIDSSLLKYKTAYMYHTKGILYSNKGRHFSAKRYFDTAILYAPTWKYALYNRAIEHAQLQEFEESIHNCEEITQKDPTFSKAYSLLGSNYEMINDYKNVDNYEKAIHFNKKALELDPSNATAYTDLGRLYSKILVNRRANLDSAMKYYKTGAENLSDENCLTMLGKMYFDMSLQRFDSSEYYYKRSLRINPFNVATLRYYAEWASIQGDSLLGNSIFQTALDSSESDYKILSAYRAYSFVNKSPEVADSLYKVIIHSNHEDPSIFLDHSRQYENIDSIEKAKMILSEGIRFINQSPSLNYALGNIFFKNYRNLKLGKHAWDSAMYYYNTTYHLAPQYSLINYGISKLYSVKKEVDSANLYISKARDLNRYVYETSNIVTDLLSLGNKALATKRYNEAVNFFKQSHALDENKYNSCMGLSRCYYLIGKLDSSTYYYYHALRYLDKPSNIIDSVMMQKDELRALIEFDANRISNALFIFEEMNKFGYNVNHLREAVCLFKLNLPRSLNKMPVLTQTDIKTIYEVMKSREGTVYSSHFLNELTKTYNYLTNTKHNNSR